MKEQYDSDGLIVKYEFDRQDEEWIEVDNKISTGKRRATSFRLSTNTISLLKQLAKSENRSLTNMVEKLIQDRSKVETERKDK